MTDKEKLADLLSYQPLYKKVDVDIGFFSQPKDIEGLTFSFLCPVDKNWQTFKLALEPDSLLRVGDTLANQQLENSFSVSQEGGRYKFTQHYSAACQYCNKYKVDFLLQIETDKPIPRNNSYKHGGEKPLQIVKKIGQFPPYEITPDKGLVNFLNEEDLNNYKKSLICLSQSYGIGAFAYLRRIVENEMISIIKDLSRIDRPESSEIKSLIASYEEDHIMTNLIEGIYNYLPSSLKSLGDNPLKKLYGQLSGGIHEFSEEECLEKASKIDTLLKFVIKKIREESSEVKAARDAMKSLG